MKRLREDSTLPLPTLGVMLGRAEVMASSELNCTILCWSARICPHCCSVAIVLLLTPDM